MRRIEVKVVPNSSQLKIVGQLGEALKVKLTATPEKGKANQQLIELLAKELEVSEKSIRIVSGNSQSRKVIEVKEG